MEAVVDLLNQVLQLFVRFATIDGGLWLVCLGHTLVEGEGR